MVILAYVLEWVLVIASVVATVFTLSAWGRRRRIRRRKTYVRDPELLALTPAVVGYYWRGGITHSSDAAATLLDLVHRGVVRLERVGPQSDPDGSVEAHADHSHHDFRLTRSAQYEHDRHGKELLLHEQLVVELVFDDAADGESSVTVDDLVRFTQQNHDLYIDLLATFCRAVHGAAGDRASEEGRSRSLGDLGVVGGGLAIIIGSLIIGAAFAAPGFYFGTVVGLALIGLAWQLPAKTPAMAERQESAEALRCYLADFGSFGDKTVEHIVLWEEYLVYAVLFGLANKAVDDIWAKRAFELTKEETVDPFWWSGVGELAVVAEQ
jgi:hypothetical protein